MLSRLKRISLSFACISLAYFTYALVAVPLFEPNSTLSASRASERRFGARDPNLERFFPPGSWELDRPWVVETDQGTLLFGKYTPLPDGRLKLSRCTVICYIDSPRTDGSAGGSLDRTRRPVILRAPQGATLNFGKTLNLLRGEFGKLVGGWLDGEISIRSPASEPGRDDELDIVTKNVQLDHQKIWTPHEVRFRYGSNVGQGRDLTIHLAGSTKQNGGGPSLGIRGVRSLELVHLDRLQLQMNGGGLFGRGNGKSSMMPAGKPAESTGSAEPSAPLEVTCRGPLRFDFQQHIISLEDHVDLIRHNANGASDQLLCQLLEIHFADVQSQSTRVEGGAASPPKKSFGKLAPTRVIAVGYPVIINAASAGVGARAERIEYDCILRRVWLKDQDKVMFHDSERRVEAPELHYSLGENGRLGALGAAGPGVVRGTTGEDGREFVVRWDGQVVMRPVDGSPVLSCTSHVRVEMANTGSFDADTLHLYLKEIPQPNDPQKTKVSLDRLHAIGNVKVVSRAITCRVAEAKIWFTGEDAIRANAGATSDSSRTPAKQQGAAGMLFGGGASQEMTAPRQQFELHSQLIEALVVLGPQPVADRLIAKGGVELREISAPEAVSLVILGDTFELQDGSSDHPRGALLGRPASVSARGLHVRGERFHVYPADNILRIVGPGTMQLPPQMVRHENSTPAEPPQVEWKQSLQFDGQLARIEGDVSVRGSHFGRNGEARFVALGDVLQVMMARPVDFQNPQTDGPNDFAEFGFEGWGFLETEMLDDAGERKLAEQVQVRQLTVNQITGEIRGQGPGWLRGTHRGRDVMGLAGNGTSLPAAAMDKNPNGLHFLRVDFDGNLAGNLHRRQIEFLNGTRTLYGPVGSWDEALDELAPEAWPSQVVSLTCDRLAVMQLEQGGQGADHIELEATGNAFVQGNSFSAQGGRISYAKDKDQLVLEGDGRNDAKLSFQRQLGSPQTYIDARKILYWPGKKEFQLVDQHQAEIFDIGQLRGRKSPVVSPR